MAIIYYRFLSEKGIDEGSRSNPIQTEKAKTETIEVKHEAKASSGSSSSSYVVKSGDTYAGSKWVEITPELIEQYNQQKTPQQPSQPQQPQQPPSSRGSPSSSSSSSSKPARQETTSEKWTREYKALKELQSTYPDVGVGSIVYASDNIPYIKTGRSMWEEYKIPKEDIKTTLYEKDITFDEKNKRLDVGAKYYYDNVIGYKTDTEGKITEIKIEQDNVVYTFSPETKEILSVYLKDEGITYDATTQKITQNGKTRSLNLLKEEDYKLAQRLGIAPQLDKETLKYTDWFQREEAKRYETAPKNLAYTIAGAYNEKIGSEVVEVKKTEEGYIVKLKDIVRDEKGLSEVLDNAVKSYKSSFPQAEIIKQEDGIYVIKGKTYTPPTYSVFTSTPTSFVLKPTKQLTTGKDPLGFSHGGSTYQTFIHFADDTEIAYNELTAEQQAYVDKLIASQPQSFFTNLKPQEQKDMFSNILQLQTGKTEKISITYTQQGNTITPLFNGKPYQDLTQENKEAVDNFIQQLTKDEKYDAVIKLARQETGTKDIGWVKTEDGWVLKNADIMKDFEASIGLNGVVRESNVKPTAITTISATQPRQATIGDVILQPLSFISESLAKTSLGFGKFYVGVGRGLHDFFEKGGAEKIEKLIFGDLIKEEKPQETQSRIAEPLKNMFGGFTISPEKAKSLSYLFLAKEQAIEREREVELMEFKERMDKYTTLESLVSVSPIKIPETPITKETNVQVPNIALALADMSSTAMGVGAIAIATPTIAETLTTKAPTIAKPLISFAKSPATTTAITTGAINVGLSESIKGSFTPDYIPFSDKGEVLAEFGSGVLGGYTFHYGIGFLSSVVPKSFGVLGQALVGAGAGGSSGLVMSLSEDVLLGKEIDTGKATTSALLGAGVGAVLYPTFKFLETKLHEAQKTAIHEALTKSKILYEAPPTIEAVEPTGENTYSALVRTTGTAKTPYGDFSVNLKGQIGFMDYLGAETKDLAIWSPEWASYNDWSSSTFGISGYSYEPPPTEFIKQTGATLMDNFGLGSYSYTYETPSGWETLVLDVRPLDTKTFYSGSIFGEVEKAGTKMPVYYDIYGRLEGKPISIEKDIYSVWGEYITQSQTGKSYGTISSVLYGEPSNFLETATYTFTPKKTGNIFIIQAVGEYNAPQYLKNIGVFTKEGYIPSLKYGDNIIKATEVPITKGSVYYSDIPYGEYLVEIPSNLEKSVLFYDTPHGFAVRGVERSYDFYGIGHTIKGAGEKEIARRVSEGFAQVYDLPVFYMEDTTPAQQLYFEKLLTEGKYTAYLTEGSGKLLLSTGENVPSLGEFDYMPYTKLQLEGSYFNPPDIFVEYGGKVYGATTPQGSSPTYIAYDKTGQAQLYAELFAEQKTKTAPLITETKARLYGVKDAYRVAPMLSAQKEVMETIERAVIQEQIRQLTTPFLFSTAKQQEIYQMVEMPKQQEIYRTIPAKLEKSLASEFIKIAEKEVRLVEQPITERIFEQPAERIIEQPTERTFIPPERIITETIVERPIEYPIEIPTILPPFFSGGGGVPAPIIPPYQPPTQRTASKSSYRYILADLFSIGKSELFFGKATHPSAKDLETSRVFWATETAKVPTVEMTKKKTKTIKNFFTLLGGRNKKRWLE